MNIDEKYLGFVKAVCLSDKKGCRKKQAESGTLVENAGFAGDAHADGSTHRQVSLLAIESIDKMRKMGLDVNPGDFAENLTTEGIDLLSLAIGERIGIGSSAVIEVTQHGKECHAPCAIYRQAGTCIMPSEGIFARVVRGGSVKNGDVIEKYSR